MTLGPDFSVVFKVFRGVLTPVGKLSNNVDPDQMLQTELSDLGFHCLH